jgi:hypothetical protein
MKCATQGTMIREPNDALIKRKGIIIMIPFLLIEFY